MICPAFVFALALAVSAPASASAVAPADVRQYYETSYTYSEAHSYYYVRYYYKPTPTYATYQYHYCIYYPSQPRYLYFYNPTSQAYWGRYEIGSEGDERYSILAEKDRKKDLKDIPESAFPKPAAMPTIPDSEDKVAMEPPPEDVPTEAKPKPKD